LSEVERRDMSEEYIYVGSETDTNEKESDDTDGRSKLSLSLTHPPAALK